MIFGDDVRRATRRRPALSAVTLLPERLELVPVDLPAGRAVVGGGAESDGPFFRGAGGVNYACPHCGFVLAERVPRGAFAGVTVACRRCARVSEFPRGP